MLPTVFLSLSGVDESFVRRVHEQLPDGLAYFFPESFTNGENLLSAMEARVEKTTILALFASKASAKSVWVNFELERARIEKIKRREFRILVFPIDSEISHADLPRWMGEQWIPKAGVSARDIARYIRNVLAEVAFSDLKASQVFGRGALLDIAVRQLQEAVFSLGRTPNILLFAGNDGIGRRTLSREFLKRGFPAKKELHFGPQLILPQFADLEDLYRALRQEIEPHFSISRFSEDILAFRNQPADHQATEIAKNISHFGALGQAVTIVTGNGIFEDRGVLKGWASQLFSALESEPHSLVCLISNRLIHENEKRNHQNLLQFSVPALANGDIRALMIAMTEDYGAAPQAPPPAILNVIGGHPQIAKISTTLLIQQGAAALENDPRQLFNIQEKILSESLNFEKLNGIQKNVLSILSWVPQLNGHLLADIVVARLECGNQDFGESVASLERGCLVQASGPNYLIAEPIRGLFRRKYGYGSQELRSHFASALKDAWSRSVEHDEMRTELFDALMYMVVLEGGTLDPAFKRLLLPSTLQGIVKTTYESREKDDKALEKVISLGLPAMSMKMEETIREEILSYVLRAQARLGQRAEAEATLQFIDSRNYRSRYYLRSFFIRHTGGDLRDAVAQLHKAFEVRKYMNMVAADLALCYQKLGRWSELKQFLENQTEYVDRNAGLLDVQIGFLIGAKRFGEAEMAITKLRNHPHDDGRSASRSAMILMHRDQNYKEAQRMLTDLLQTKGGGQVPTRRLRGIAAAYAGDEVTARNDIEFLRGRPGGADTAHRIEARLKLTLGDWKSALSELNSVRNVTYQDELLRARILEVQLRDIEVPLSQRGNIEKEIVRLRGRHDLVSEFESDI